MGAWAENQGVSQLSSELESDLDDSIIHLFGDPYGEVTESLDMELTAVGPKMVGLVQRCKRFALYVVNGTVEIKRIAEADNDPAGDDYPDVTLAESMIMAIDEFNTNQSITEFNNNNGGGGGEEL